MKMVKAEFYIDEKMEEALQEILSIWQGKKGKDGNYPFRDYGTEDVLRALIVPGGADLAWSRILREQLISDMITYEEFKDGRKMTVAERRAATPAI